MLFLIFLLACSSLFGEGGTAFVSTLAPYLQKKNPGVHPSIELNVNPVTGEYCEEECDLIVAGIQPLSYRRFYAHKNGYEEAITGHWTLNPETTCLFDVVDERCTLVVGEGNGGIFRYERAEGDSLCRLAHAPSYTNSTGSGLSHPQNTEIELRRDGEEISFRYRGAVRSGDQSVRLFSSEKRIWPQSTCDSGVIERMFPRAFYPARVEKEILPNGNVLLYTYENENDPKRIKASVPPLYLLKKITAKDSKEKKKLAEITITYPRFGSKFLRSVRAIEIKGSDGRSARCVHEKRMIVEKRRPETLIFDSVLHAVQGAGKTTQAYRYQHGGRRGAKVEEKVERYRKECALIQTTTRGGILMGIEYDAKRRVQRLTAPVGERGMYCPIATYHYGALHTEVVDAEGYSTHYRYDDRGWITHIERGGRIEERVWSACGDLKKNVISDQMGTVLKTTHYTYDADHNAVEEKSASHTIMRTYAHNRLVEERQGNKRTTYRYDPKRPALLLEEALYDGETLCRRTTHMYDSAACRIKTVIEQEVGGKIIHTTPKKGMPCCGLPEVVEECTLDGELIKRVIYTYTPFGAVATEAHYDAQNVHRYTLTNTYDENELLVASTDALGEATTYAYDTRRNLIAVTKGEKRKRIAYDSTNRVTEVSACGLITRYTYDKLGQLTSVMHPSGEVTRYRYDCYGQKTETHHPDGGVERITYDLLGNPIEEIDSRGYVTKKEYDSAGHPLKISHPDGSCEAFTYDQHGRKATHTDKNGALTRYTYDRFDHIISTKTSYKGDELKTTSARYCGDYLLSQTDPNGVTTTYTYNAFGQKVRETREGRVIHYCYDALGRCTHVKEGDSIQESVFDLLNRLIVKRSYADNSLLTEERYAYDAVGNLIATITDAGSYKNIYNEEGHLICKEDPLSNATYYTYEYGRVIAESRPNGVILHTEYDCCGRPTELTKMLGKETLQRVQKRYDQAGNCIEEQHFVYAQGAVVRTVTHTFSYGPLNRLEEWVEGGEREYRYAYDRCGRVCSLVTPTATLSYLYDALGQLVRHYGPDFDYRYTYDHNGNLLTASNGSCETTRSYNEHNQLIKEKLENDLVLCSTFDEQGRRIHLTYPDASISSYTYCGEFLQSVTRNTCTCTLERNLRGKIIAIHHPIGTTSYRYDACARLTAIEGEHISAVYTYDQSDRLVSSNGHAYAYDALDQLISEPEHTYHYDSLYNRERKDEQSYVYDALGQITAFTYDRNGNLIDDGVWHHAYDTQNRLIRSQSGERLLEYSYDPFHRRLSKTSYVGGRFEKSERYLWDGESEIGSVVEGDIKELRILGEGYGAEIGAPLILELDRTYFSICDHQGSIAAIIDLEGCAQTFSYTAYGEGDMPLPWGFTSKRRDCETELIYFGRRYYNPARGRWLTRDPLGLSAGPNLYAYVHNNPLTQIDPYGLWGRSLFGRGVGYLRKVSYPIFKSLELTGQHLIPVAGIRDLVEAVGRWGQGGEFFELAQYRKNQNQIIHIPGKEGAGPRIVYINGMATLRAEALAQAGGISQAYGGRSVDLLYNGSQGFMMDLIQCGMAKLGIRTPVERMCAHYFSHEMAQDPTRGFHVIAHSQGATHLMNSANMLPATTRQQMDVRGFGGATLFHKARFRSAENYVSKRDIVPLTNPLRYLAARFSRGYNFHLLKSYSSNLLDEHELLSGSYLDTLQELGQQFSVYD